MEETSPFGHALLVTGPESLLAERAAAGFVARAMAERADAAVVRLEAGRVDAGSLAEAAGGSLFAAATVLVMTELSELPAELSDLVVAMATEPGPDLALALVHPGGNKGKALLDRLRKLRLEVADCPSIKSWDLPQFVSAVRDLANEGIAGTNLLWSLVGAAIVVAIFAPLTVRAYMRKA